MSDGVCCVGCEVSHTNNECGGYPCTGPTVACCSRCLTVRQVESERESVIECESLADCSFSVGLVVSPRPPCRGLGKLERMQLKQWPQGVAGS